MRACVVSLPCGPPARARLKGRGSTRASMSVPALAPLVACSALAVVKRETCTRSSPSTRTLVVPFETRVACCRRARTPMRYRSVPVGTFTSALRCVTSRISLLPSRAAVTAASDASRPMRRGMATWGNSTTSRSGRTGSFRLPVLEVRCVLRLPSSAAWARSRGAGGRRAAPQPRSPEPPPHRRGSAVRTWYRGASPQGWRASRAPRCHA